MQRDIVVKGRGLGGSSDLTLLAPIKPGFVESLESVTFKTRVKRVLDTLHGARSSSHEYAAARLLSDSVERVGAIHSVRVAVLEPEDKVMLAVTFDGSWETYIRVLWEKVGSLLDLIFCGTVGYVLSSDSYEDWCGWVRSVQVETGFFYGPPDATARDALYHRRVERLREPQGPDHGDLQALRAVLPTAEESTRRLLAQDHAFADDPQLLPVQPMRMVVERMRNGLQGLALLYRLTELHRPGTPDGEVLRRAAVDLLLEFVQLRDADLLPSSPYGGQVQQALAAALDRFPRQLPWLFPDPSASPLLHKPMQSGHLDAGDEADIQGGILHAYDQITHGVVLLCAFDDTAAAHAFLADVDARITRVSDQRQAMPGRVLYNLAFTLAGLRAAGMSEDQLALFPQEYRQGMAMRAGALGDVRNNHPLRWRLPRRFAGVDARPGPEQVQLDSVHVALHLRCGATGAAAQALELQDKHHPLRAEVRRVQGIAGLRILGVQPLKRNYQTGTDGAKQTVEHFGFVDGGVVPDPVHPGELVLGHGNAADAPVDLNDPNVPDTVRERLRWLRNGSFLVVRKYRQFANRLEHAVAATATDMAREFGDTKTDYRKLVYGKLMGRQLDAKPLIPSRDGLNDFDYTQDAEGRQCPLHAHIRRANPRVGRAEMLRQPVIARRGMSYGPPPGAGRPEDERGLVFMAYNANLGEQFELIQRWLAGGNSTGASSGQSCPFLGVPDNGVARHFRFEHTQRGKTRMFTVQLEQPTALFDEPAVNTQLEWGLYLFTPSVSALRRLRSLAAGVSVSGPAVPWQVSRGRTQIAALQGLEAEGRHAEAAQAWKTALEDADAVDRLDSAALWAAIREDHGGLLKTAYGTLVASRERIQEVMQDREQRYSVRGQLARMRASFGEIYLGMDAGPVYEQQSAAINRLIGSLDDQQVFQLALQAGQSKLKRIVDPVKLQFRAVGSKRFELSLDAREVVDEVLGAMCEAWFGLKGQDAADRFVRGSADWNWTPGQRPIYPGHFIAMSRYMFQPNPGPLPVELGVQYGQSLRQAMNLFVADHRAAGTIPQAPGGGAAPIAQAIFGHVPLGGDNDFVARTMVGVLMGFVPPVTGAVLNVLREWQRDGSFGALRLRLAGRTDYASVRSVLAGPMAAAARMRPMPQSVWRTALKPHRVGDSASGVDVAAGDIVVLGLVSGTQQSLADGQPDGELMFGGDRSAPGHPTHACPGRGAGLGAMLGSVAALLTWADPIRVGSAPLSFIIDGALPAAVPAPPAPAPGKPGGSKKQRRTA